MIFHGTANIAAKIAVIASPAEMDATPVPGMRLRRSAVQAVPLARASTDAAPQNRTHSDKSDSLAEISGIYSSGLPDATGVVNALSRSWNPHQTSVRQSTWPIRIALAALEPSFRPAFVVAVSHTRVVRCPQ